MSDDIFPTQDWLDALHDVDWKELVNLRRLFKQGTPHMQYQDRHFLQAVDDEIERRERRVPASHG